MNRYSLKDISKMSGISVPTISRYLNGQSVKPSTEQKIKKVLETSGYTPNAAARFMKGSSTGIIGLILPEIAHHFFSIIAEGVISEARNNHQLVILGSSYGTLENEARTINRFSSSILDGLIYIPIAKAENIPEIEKFRDLPLVVAARRNLIADIPHVYHDGEKGGYLATKYLISLGRTRIAFIASFWEAPCKKEDLLLFVADKNNYQFSSLERFKGYLKALKEADLPFDPSLVYLTNYDFVDGEKVAKELIEGFTGCDGIIAMTHTVAEGLSFQLGNQGIRVPNDISIVVFESEMVHSEYYTYINLHLFEMGQIAVRLLNKKINRQPVSDICLDVNLIIQKSTVAKRKKRIT
jgi:LacI family transcriptional regulator